MLNEITYIIDYLNVLIKEYPLVFHAFVPVGTILTAILGMKNASHIKTQANIQREIESNRFNIQLFEHRNKSYNDFKNNVDGKDFTFIKVEDFVHNDVIESIRNDLNYIKNALFVFNLEDNKPLFECFAINEEIRLSVNSIEASTYMVEALDRRINIIDLEEKEDDHEYYSSIIDDINKDKERILQEINEHKEFLMSSNYRYSCYEACEYMESKLLIPKEAFQPKISFFRRTWNALSRDEKMVMYAILGICALGLWCALLFGVAFKK